LKDPQIIRYSKEDAYLDLLNFFGLKNTSSHATVIAAILRRLCGFMCPCPASALIRAACQSLSILPIDAKMLRDQIEKILEDMTICGDLLELSHMVISGRENHPNWLYCALPSFARHGNRIHVFGIAADGASFLPDDLCVHLQYEGALRFLDIDCEQSLVAQLSGLGLREISPDAWMVSTRREPAETVVDRYTKKLISIGMPGEFQNSTLLKPNTQQRISYSDRWTHPSKESGRFVARVPQPYGAPLWYFCALRDGVVQRSLLLPLKESSERACDAAWRLQLALDAATGNPATYSVRQDQQGTGVFLRFNFPLPLAVRRRLLVLGAGHSEDNPYQYWLPTAGLASEKRFLCEYYWIEEQMESIQ